ncbi:MAG: 30S ribosome-binding factor RbfA [Alphaproteobacteria bacterium]|nr:MAG: 30S ribosome-binding factor RbfA [Alphaproteobacteria bacterium]
MAGRSKSQKKSTRGDRNLRVGEEIRHAVSAMLMRGEVHQFESYGIAITVTEVRVSSDLRHANIFVMPLGGQKQNEILKNLRNPEVVKEFRMLLADAVKLQFVPNIRFELDTSFDEGDKITRLLRADEEKRKSSEE